MKSATSFFDLHTVRKDITRFAPLWGIYLIGGILVMLTSLSSNLPYHVAGNLVETLAGFSVINMLYAGLVAMLLFGDLFNSRLCNALHAMPLRRETWFVSHVVSGLAFSIVPHAIAIAFLAPMMLSYEYVGLIWLLGMILEYLFFFGLAVFSVFCAGNRFAMIAVYAILNSASVLALSFIISVYEPLMFGMKINQEPFQLLCPVFQMVSYNDIDDFIIFKRPSPGDMARSDIYSDYYSFGGLGPAWNYLWVIAAIGVALLALSLILYRRRALETAGDFMAVRPLAPVFSLIYTLTIGILFHAMGDLLIGQFSVFLTVGIIIGYFTSQMLLQRTVKIFKPKAFLKCGGILVLLLVSMGLTWLDPLGISQYVPKPEKVEQLQVEIVYGRDQPLVFTDEEVIRDFTELHRQLIDAGRSDGGSGQRFTVEYTYTMKNGATIFRTYNFRKTSPIYNILKTHLSDPKHLLGYTDWNDYVNRVIMIDIQPLGKIPESKHKALLDAIKADCEAGNLIQNDSFQTTDKYAYASFEGWITIVTESESGQQVAQELQYFSTAKNIMAFIKENE